MNDMFDNFSRFAASKMPRREIFRLVGLGIVGSALSPFIPKRAEADFICRLGDRTVNCTGPDQCCFYTVGTIRSVFCCSQDDKCCRAEAGICCPKNYECCSSITAQCCRPQGTNGPGDKGEKCCSTALAALVCCDLNTHCCSIDTLGECVTKAGMKIIRFRTAAPAGIVIEVVDPDGKGLVSISVADSVNASVQIPPLPPGTTIADVTASRIDPNQPARVVLRVCTRGKCCVDGDPTLTALQIGEGRNDAKDTFFDIRATERFLRIQNGRPGLRRVEVLVNGRSLTERWLRDGNVRLVDLAPLMTTRRNEVTLLANGRPGSSGVFLISDLPDSEGNGNSAEQPLIEWQPGSWDPGVNLHWGR